MKTIVILIIAVIISGCDKGLAPEPVAEEAGFSGAITFSGTWPDSVQRTHLIVFRDPINSAGDFNFENLGYVSPGIPNGAEIYNYNTNDTALVPIKAGTYSYVAVAQSKTPELALVREAWYVVGVYYNPGDTTHPGTLYIPENTLVKDINILCDFDNPPPQPPGG